MKDNLIKKAYISAFDIEDKYLKDLIVINTILLKIINYLSFFFFRSKKKGFACFSKHTQLIV